jgi:hypothetical protein
VRKRRDIGFLGGQQAARLLLGLLAIIVIATMVLPLITTGGR